MKIGIIGLGIQGSALALVLSKIQKEATLVLVDSDLDKISTILKHLDQSKTESYCIDINEIYTIENKLSKISVLFDMLLPEHTEKVMHLALRIHSNYINTAFDNPFWNAIINKEVLPLDNEFKKAGLTALIGCGDSPGLVNIFVRKYCDKLSEVKDIKIYGAYKSQQSDYFDGWNPGWSVKQAYLDFVTNPVVFRNGTYKQVPPFSEREMVEIYSYGIKEVAVHSHEESYSLPLTIKKGINNCEFKYEIDPFPAILYNCGFKANSQIEVDGKMVNTLTILFKVFEKANTNMVLSPDDEYCSTIEIIGFLGQKKKKYKIVLPPLYQNRKAVLEMFETTKIDVALPAAIGFLCLSDLKTGIHFAEELNPKHFEAVLNQYIAYSEIVEEI